MGATAATVNIGSLRQRRRELRRRRRRRRLRSPFPFPSTPLFSPGNCLDSRAKARTGPGVFLHLKCTFLCGVNSALLFRLTCRTQGAKIFLFCFVTFLSLFPLFALCLIRVAPSHAFTIGFSVRRHRKMEGGKRKERPFSDAGRMADAGLYRSTFSPPLLLRPLCLNLKKK